MSLELQQAIQSYENYISDNGIDESVIDAMIEACKVAYQTEKDIPYALKASARTKEIIERFVLNLTGAIFGDWRSILLKTRSSMKL